VHAHDALIDLPTTAQPLPGSPDGMRTALGRPRLVETPDGLGVPVFAGHDPLALVTHPVFFPLDRLHKTL
jgi:hypothetical protein